MMPRAVPLPAVPTLASVTAKLPAEQLDCVGAWVDSFVYTPSWPERMAVVESWLRPTVLRDGSTDKVVTSLTAALEQLGERDLTDVNQAVLYRLSLHPDWRSAAMRFLSASANVDAWTAEYPGIAAVALARMAAESQGPH